VLLKASPEGECFSLQAPCGKLCSKGNKPPNPRETSRVQARPGNTPPSGPSPRQPCTSFMAFISNHKCFIHFLTCLQKPDLPSSPLHPQCPDGGRHNHNHSPIMEEWLGDTVAHTTGPHLPWFPSCETESVRARFVEKVGSGDSCAHSPGKRSVGQEMGSPGPCG
jgi:hypothetical protein